MEKLDSKAKTMRSLSLLTTVPDPLRSGSASRSLRRVSRAALAGMVLLLSVVHPVQGAALFQLDFQASGFVQTAGPAPVPVPQDPVFGSIEFIAASPTAGIDTLTDISLTIAGFTYSLSDVGFRNAPSRNVVSELATSGSVDGILLGLNNNDFFLDWFRDTGQPNLFIYKPGGVRAMFQAATFDRFSVVEVISTPEPTTVLLFVLGLLGLGRARRWFH